MRVLRKDVQTNGQKKGMKEEADSETRADDCMKVCFEKWNIFTKAKVLSSLCMRTYLYPCP